MGAGSSSENAETGLRILNNPYNPWKEAFVYSLTKSWKWVALVFVGHCLLETFVFGCIYFVLAAGSNGFCLSPEVLLESTAPLTAAFTYALSLSTTGPSIFTPCLLSITIVANIHSILTQLHLVLVTGVAFTILSQPSASILCANTLLITNFRGKRSLVGRMVVTRDPAKLLDVRMTMTMFHQDSSSSFRRIRSLELTHPEHALLRYGVYAIHVIDEDCPLYEMSRETLISQECQFRFTIMGLVEASMQSVHSTQDYSVSKDEVKFDRQFADFIYTHPTLKERVLDHERVHCLTDEADVPADHTADTAAVTTDSADMSCAAEHDCCCTDAEDTDASTSPLRQRKSAGGNNHHHHHHYNNDHLHWPHAR